MSRHGELFEPSDVVRGQIEAQSYRGFGISKRRSVAIISSGLLAVAAFAAIVLEAEGTQVPSASAPSSAGSSRISSSIEPSRCDQVSRAVPDPEQTIVSLCLLMPIPNPRTVTVLETSSVQVVSSLLATYVGKQCTVYAGGEIFERGDYDGKIFAGYRPAGRYRAGECTPKDGFWEPESVFPPQS